MNHSCSSYRVHFVKGLTLGSSVSPYDSRLGAVRYLSYARFQAALNSLRPVPGGRALDFGCWTGHFLPSLMKYFPDVWGVDDDSASVLDAVPDLWTILQVARRLCESEAGIRAHPGLVKATGSALPFSDGYFDVVFCIDTLTHVPISRRLDVIHELRRITKPDGQLIFSLPIETGPMQFLKGVARTLTGKRIDPDTRCYDFRGDLESLRSSFSACKTRFFPVDRLGSLNPFVVADCRMEPGRFEGSATEWDCAVV